MAQGGKWCSAHVDDLRPSPHSIQIEALRNKSIRELVEEALKQDPTNRQHLASIKVKGMRPLSVRRPSLNADDSMFDDMPGLEEPDDDIDVYRPEREANRADRNEANEEEEAVSTDMEVDTEEYAMPEEGALDLHHLLYSCSSKATTMLRDIDHQHTLARIHYVKQLFPEPDKATGSLFMCTYSIATMF